MSDDARRVWGRELLQRWIDEDHTRALWAKEAARLGSSAILWMAYATPANEMSYESARAHGVASLAAHFGRLALGQTVLVNEFASDVVDAEAAEERYRVRAVLEGKEP